MATTAVISFRAHKNLKSWLEYAGKGFQSDGELLRLILTKAAIEQASESGASGFLRDMMAKREHAQIGDTKVFAARVPTPTSELIRQCASGRGKSTSEWCSLVLMDWWQYFRSLKERFKDRGTDWLTLHASEYRALVTNSHNVYAQQMAKRRSKAKV